MEEPREHNSEEAEFLEVETKPNIEELLLQINTNIEEVEIITGKEKLEKVIQKLLDVVKKCYWIMDVSLEPETSVTVQKSSDGIRIYQVDVKTYPFKVVTEVLPPLDGLFEEAKGTNFKETQNQSSQTEEEPINSKVKETTTQSSQTDKEKKQSNFNDKYVQTEGEKEFPVKEQALPNDLCQPEAVSSSLSSSSASQKRIINEASSSSDKKRKDVSPPTNETRVKKLKGEGERRKLKDYDKSPSHVSSSSSGPVSACVSKNPIKTPTVNAADPCQNVLLIPNDQRRNYGCTEMWELEQCPLAIKFWYDQEHSEENKILLRIHDDRWPLATRTFFIMEQIGLRVPSQEQIKFHEIMEKLQSVSDVSHRIWLDFRDFYCFHPGIRSLYSNLRIRNSITHFHFGGRLHSDSDNLVNSNLLLEFLFCHTPNLEYLALNDSMLGGLDNLMDPNIEDHVKFHNLKTLRFINTKFKFTNLFISRVLNRSPNLETLYGIPLHCLGMLNDTESFKSREGKIFIRSIFIWRNRYSQPNFAPFHHDLNILSRMKKFTRLEEFSAYTTFMRYTGTRSQCIQIMSTILNNNRRSLVKLALEPIIQLRIPRDMPNLKIIQCDFNSSEFSGQFPFFSSDCDFSKTFSKLSTVEIYSDFRDGNTTTEKLLEKFIPLAAPNIFHSVRRLKLNRFTPTENMSTFFPNVRTLHLSHNLGSMYRILPKCFQYFVRLQELIIEVESGGNLDASITGICKDTCKVLEDLNPLSATEKDVDDMIKLHRTQRSIADLKELRSLRLVLRPGRNTTPVMTPISIVYGFRRHKLPELNIEIGFHEKTSADAKEDMILELEPIQSYIKLI